MTKNSQTPDLTITRNPMLVAIGVTAPLYGPPKYDSKTLFLVYEKK